MCARHVGIEDTLEHIVSKYKVEASMEQMQGKQFDLTHPLRIFTKLIL